LILGKEFQRPHRQHRKEMATSLVVGVGLSAPCAGLTAFMLSRRSWN
jgi:hypothetical protein